MEFHSFLTGRLVIMFNSKRGVVSSARALLAPLFTKTVRITFEVLHSRGACISIFFSELLQYISRMYNIITITYMYYILLIVKIAKMTSKQIGPKI